MQRHTAEPHCDSCEARQLALVGALEEQSMLELECAKSTQYLHKGQYLYYEGSPPLAVYCIHEGAVKLYKMGEGGDAHVTHVLRRGSTIGYASMLSEAPHAATAQALTNVTACVIPKVTLYEMLARSKPFALRVMRKLAEELRAAQDETLSLTQQSVKRRVAQLVIHLYGEDFASDPVLLQRKEMAQMIGTTPETLSRQLRGFSEQGLIRLSRLSIHILKPEKLQALASGGSD